ncbi:MAG: hypothetical protein AABN34_29370 [Acidobacteriota bacterium]
MTSVVDPPRLVLYLALPNETFFTGRGLFYEGILIAETSYFEHNLLKEVTEFQAGRQLLDGISWRALSDMSARQSLKLLL